MQNNSAIAEIGEWIVDRLRCAGTLALSERSDAKVIRKGAHDLLTDVDTAIEDLLIEDLQVATPGWGIVAEERYQGDSAIGEGRWWILDPLDGTVNFAAGVPAFCISLALLDEGVPIVGAVYDLAHDEVFEANKGGGARMNGAPIAVPASPVEVPLVAASSGFLGELAATAGGSKLRRLLQTYPKIRNLGSQSLHLCYVACGRFSAAGSVEARIWDDAAGALIATEAGARYTELDGQPLFPVQRTGRCMRSLAAGPLVHERILAITNEIEEKGLEV